jgi:hypothetical protein
MHLQPPNSQSALRSIRIAIHTAPLGVSRSVTAKAKTTTITKMTYRR